MSAFINQCFNAFSYSISDKDLNRIVVNYIKKTKLAKVYYELEGYREGLGKGIFYIFCYKHDIAKDSINSVGVSFDRVGFDYTPITNYDYEDDSEYIRLRLEFDEYLLFDRYYRNTAESLERLLDTDKVVRIKSDSEHPLIIQINEIPPSEVFDFCNKCSLLEDNIKCSSGFTLSQISFKRLDIKKLF